MTDDAARDAEYSRRIAAVFDVVAPGYDSPALRFFPFVADRLIARINPRRGEKILDVAAGTGAVALAAAQAVAPDGRVTAIDLAEQMLAQLDAKRRKFGIENLDVHVMNARHLEFRRDYFHHTVSSFGIFFLPDMLAGLREWARVTRPGGTVTFTVFGAQAFQPMMGLFLSRVRAAGVTIPENSPRRAAERLQDPEVCRSLAVEAGLTDVSVEREVIGYHLRDTNDWWEILWNSGTRAALEQLTPEQRDALRTVHVAEVAALASADGIYLNVETLVVSGRKQAG
jgi:arsenite methyltransferase